MTYMKRSTLVIVRVLREQGVGSSDCLRGIRSLMVGNQNVLGLRQINARRKTEQNHKFIKPQKAAYVKWLNLFCEFLLNKQT